jgi:hypothetical protein
MGGLCASSHRSEQKGRKAFPSYSAFIPQIGHLTFTAAY